ncbi:MAG TPA: hypothetical protein VFZ25_16565, partial [Chloroflexota bacterium]|nr:hypothetical protein [Chloroflexota bacterium]
MEERAIVPVKRISTLTRRSLLARSVAATAGALLVACAPGEQTPAQPTSAPVPTVAQPALAPLPTATPAGAASAAPTAAATTVAASAPATGVAASPTAAPGLDQ